ncbi:MAG: PAS domain S-box protein [Methylomonas sp.]|jgi:PAS domain S-box-containing protein
MQSLLDLFGVKDFIPHGYCLSWSPVLLWLHVISDLLIAVAYYSIPLIIIYFVRKQKDLPYPWLALMVAVFILSCGTTHLLSAITIWIPVYWFDGLIKAITAILSISSSVLMLWIVPKALSLPSAKQLQYEIQRRIKVEAQLQLLANTATEALKEHKQLNEAILNSEKEFRSLAEAMPQIVWVTRADGWNTYFNQQWVEYTGMTLEESYGHGWNTPFHPIDQQRAWDAWHNAVNNNGSYSLECRLRRFDGVYRWWLIRGAPVTDEVGKIYKWFGTCTDIHDIKTIENELRENRELLSNIIDSTPSFIFALDLQQRFTLLNEAMAKFFGASKENILGRTICDFFPKEIADTLMAANSNIMASGESMSFEETVMTNVHNDPRILMTSKFPLLDVQGEIIGVGGVATDITEQKRTEQELLIAAIFKKNRAQFEAFINHAPISMAMFDRNMNYLSTSGRWLNDYSRGYANLVGLNHYQVHPDLPENWKIAYQQGLAGVTLKNDEDLWIQADGSRHWLCWAVVPWIDENSEIGGIIVSAEDITSRKLNEEKLAEKTQKLYESDQRKDQFLAMLAHELRNPLAPIRNAAEILKRTDLEPDRIAWCSRIIDRQTEHMVGIVDDLLDVSRINRGLIELNKESLDIRDVILPAIESCRPLIDAKRHEFRLQLPPEPLWVEGDRIRLTQVVANLINNAAKYTEEGGRINLSVELSEEMVCIKVLDNGCGIDPADLPNLFDLFYQTDRNLDRSQGGLGIGLSLVKNLVAKHGGNVRALSAGRGQGSEFVVRLHRHVLDKPVAVCTAALTVPPQKKLRILLVDDNRDAAESLAIVLKIDGHHVQTAYDGPAALELARAERPDVILLDIGLPGMNGYEVAQEIRRYGELERTLLIALTGYGQRNDLEKSRAAGFDAHLVKPPNLEMLRKLLAEHEGR